MANLLEIGNKIVYGKTGVCTVVGQCEQELSRNVKKQYFVLKPFGSDTNTIFVPVENNKVFMRPLISKEEAKDLINRIPEIIGSTADIELSKEQYELMVSTHNPSYTFQQSLYFLLHNNFYFINTPLPLIILFHLHHPLIPNNPPILNI